MHGFPLRPPLGKAAQGEVEESSSASSSSSTSFSAKIEIVVDGTDASVGAMHDLRNVDKLSAHPIACTAAAAAARRWSA